MYRQIQADHNVLHVPIVGPSLHVQVGTRIVHFQDILFNSRAGGTSFVLAWDKRHSMH